MPYQITSVLSQILRMLIWMPSSVNYALSSDAVTVISPRLLHRTHKEHDPPAQGSIQVTIPTLKMKEVLCLFSLSPYLIRLIVL